MVANLGYELEENTKGQGRDWHLLIFTLLLLKRDKVLPCEWVWAMAGGGEDKVNNGKTHSPCLSPSLGEFGIEHGLSEFGLTGRKWADRHSGFPEHCGQMALRVTGASHWDKGTHRQHYGLDVAHTPHAHVLKAWSLAQLYWEVMKPLGGQVIGDSP